MTTTTTQKAISEKFAGLSDDARLWIFQSERKLEPHEINMISNHLSQFVENWTSHNRELLAQSAVVLDHFVLIALDESRSSSASGCSIDNMTHQIQSLGAHLGLNLMDRTTFYFLKEGEVIEGIVMNDVAEAYRAGKINDSSRVFNSLIKSKSDLDDGWLIPLGESWHKRFV